MGRHRKGFAPVPPPTEVALLGPLVYCARCHEWWPADDEFYNLNEHGRCVPPCKACRAEWLMNYRQKAREHDREKRQSV